MQGAAAALGTTARAERRIGAWHGGGAAPPGSLAPTPAPRNSIKLMVHSLAPYSYSYKSTELLHNGSLWHVRV